MTTRRMKEAITSDSFWKIMSRGAAIVATVTLLTSFVSEGRWRERVEQRLAHVEEKSVDIIEAQKRHEGNKSDHMPFDDKIKTFVLRSEWLAQQAQRDRQLSEIKESSLRTEDRVEKIYDLLRKP